MHARPAFSMSLAAALVAASLAAAALTTPPVSAAAPRERLPREAAAYDAPTERWREGPVRYLLTKDEDDAFRSLRDDDERAAFIASFWSRRDPDPSTPQNEFRDRFYARVEAANHQFTESTKEGWRTDRGKIYTLLGPPDDLDERKRRSISADVILWTYRNPPPGVGAGAQATIRFERDLDGEYRLSNDIHLDGLESSLSIGLQTQALQVQTLPEARRLLDGVVATRAYPALPFRTHRDFFASSGGDTFTVLTLGIRPGLLDAGDASPARAEGAAAPAATRADRLEVLARLVGEGNLPTYDWSGPKGFREGATAAADAVRMFQAGAPVRPGDYMVHYAIVDREADRVYSYHEALSVPDFSDDRFTLSSISLASRLERLPESRSSGYAAPFVFGDLRVLPRPDDAYHAGDDLAFYFQVHGAAGDPIDGRPDLDIVYRFFHVAAPGAPAGAGGAPATTPLGQPIFMTRQRRPVQGFTLPLRDWPRGDYRLRVEATDNLDGRRASQEADFRVF